MQIVNGSAPHLEPTIDLRGMDEQRQESEVRLALKKQFDSPNPPAMSFALVRYLAETEHLLIVTASALCADIAAVVNVVREVQAVYSGRNIDDEQALQYADLSEWQNQLLESPSDQNHTPYWKSAEFPDLFPRLPFLLRRDAAAGWGCLRNYRASGFRGNIGSDHCAGAEPASFNAIDLAGCVATSA